ncbi:CaiB/BaiF CoA-transferase family protein [Jatrophihabitans endophyticus]|uniref:CaiB/BaiF CoA transferase family protein n=1 Tax=Jatrophihabitans endophyticus TaxID=1206085 RepID=UPI0019F6169D|nr:CoA transferase [Jatrophihabitans endophyticus]MBE7187446.1 CoA transferase [Jatrophihabitans endophyticus]
MKPLEGVRVVSLEQYGAGPFATMHLAALGAEIIKIEDPRTDGDIGRYVPPFNEGEDSLFFESFNRNKSSITLDISVPAGRAVFDDLIRSADALFSNLRGDVPAKLKIRYEDLCDVNPAIVCCSLTGFGMDGPRSTQPGYDYVLQALAGWMAVTGEPGGPPQKSGLSLVDYSGGLVASIAILAGVHAARRDGLGMDCDLSLYDTAIGMLTYVGTWHLNEGWQPQRMSHSAHPSLVPFQAFEAKDGWLIVGCAKEKFWTRLTEVIDRPDLAQDPRFRTFADRGRHRDELIPVLEKIFAERTVAEWLEPMRAASIPSAPIHDVSEALADEHTVAREMIVETQHPRYGRMRSIASPVRVGPRLQGDENRRGPLLGEHTQAVLRELGYTDDAIAAARSSGAFGDDRDDVNPLASTA